jgi:flagellar motor switch protein FliN/FliY
MSEQEQVGENSAPVEDDWAAAMQEQRDTEGPATDSAADKTLASADFQELKAEAGNGSEINIEAILDVPVTISMEIGRTQLTIRNLLQLTQGSVIELDRLAGEPMDVLVNGTLIAQGEVVVVNEKFGIRLTDVISAANRIKRLV